MQRTPQQVDQWNLCVCCAAAIGFNVETVSYKNIKFQVWDLGGQTSIRPYWRCYYPNTQAIIYVVDSTDTDRIGTSREEFHAILEEEELKDSLILVYANKQVRRGGLGRVWRGGGGEGAGGRAEGPGFTNSSDHRPSAGLILGGFGPTCK